MNWDLLIGIWSGIFGLVFMFIYCYFAERTTASLADIGEAAYKSQWYLYPANVRKHIILIIRRSQMSFEFHGMKIIYCNLETFCKVNANSLSNRQLFFIKFLFVFFFLFLIQLIRLIWTYSLMLQNSKN